MYELKKIGKVLTSKSVGTGPSSYEKRIYRAGVSQILRNTGLVPNTARFQVPDLLHLPAPNAGTLYLFFSLFGSSPPPMSPVLLDMGCRLPLNFIPKASFFDPHKGPKLSSSSSSSCS